MLSKRFAVLTAIGALAGTASGTASSDEVQITDNNIKTSGGQQVFFNGHSTNINDCDDDCRLNWPPVVSTDVLASNNPMFTEDVLPDGNYQLLYDRRPLYTCNSDLVSNCETNTDSWPFAKTLASGTGAFPTDSATTTHDCGNELTSENCAGHDGGGHCEWDDSQGEGVCVSKAPSSSSSSSGCSGLPVVEWAVEIADIADGAVRTALCSDHHVLCGADSIVAKFNAGDTTLSYDDSNDWQVTSAAGEVLLTAQGYKNSYALTTIITELELVDLVALNAGLDSPVTNVSNCDSTFQAAVDAYTALQAPCEEVGNAKKDLPGACDTGYNACVVGYEYSNLDEKCKVKLVYEELQEGDPSTKAQHKRDHFKSIREGGVTKRDSENDDQFKKRKFAQMKSNTRDYFKQKMQDKINLNTDPNKKKHQMRKEERMPVSIAHGSDDFKEAFIGTLRTKFGLQTGQDRDVGIIVGPEKNEDTIACKADMTGDAEYDEILDSDDCITYDAAIDGDTTDVHVLGADGAYNIGGILVGDKYVPVVKQTLANADAEMYEMSCWTGSAWALQGTAFVAGNEVSCTVSRSGIVVKVDTIVGSTVTGQVEGDKCDEGFGCEDADDNDVCDTPLTCKACLTPEANNDVDATVCAAQLCEAGKGYDAIQGFDPSLDPTDTTNTNCHTCNDGTYNTGGNGQCVAYSTSCDHTGYARDSSHNNKTLDAPCVDVQAPSFTSGTTPTATTIVIDENVGEWKDWLVVYTANATDNVNADDTIEFYLKSGYDSQKFSITGNKVSLKEQPDYATKSSYFFTVRAYDKANNFAEQAVTLAINNVADVVCEKALDCNNVGTASGFRDSTDGCSCDCNSANTGKQGEDCSQSYDNIAPKFTSADTASVAENVPVNTLVYTAGADEPVTFSLSGTDATYFSIHGTTGEVTLTTNLDYETKSSYSFTVVATDAAGNEATQVVTLTILNNLGCEAGEGCVAGTRSGDSCTCEACALPEANPGEDFTECANQVCNEGRGAYNEALQALSSDGFDTTLNPAVDNDNCVDCGDGFYSSIEDGYCRENKVCGAGEYTTSVGTTQANTVCAPCNAGKFKIGTSTSYLDTTECSDLAVCAMGEFTEVLGTVKKATKCTSCPGGWFNAAAAATYDDVVGCTELTKCLHADDKSIRVSGSLKSDNQCCHDADHDDTCDFKTSDESEATGVVGDDCVIRDCTDKQLSDAYALLKSSGACSTSRRQHEHTEDIGRCYTSGCASETGSIETKFVCPAE